MTIKMTDKHFKPAKSRHLYNSSRDLLKNLGNDAPDIKQIELMVLILSKVAVLQDLSFNHALTDREIYCLYWAAMGKTSTQTAELLNVQRYTVEQHRKEIKRKLDCQSMAQAVFKGMQFGYVPLEIK